MINESRMEAALEFLASTDKDCAELKAQVSRLEYACKLARARMFLVSEEKSVEAKKADAERSHDVQEAEDRLAEGIAAFESMKAQRTTAEITCDLWRTEAANQRAAA